MAGGIVKGRKRVEASSEPQNTTAPLLRGKGGSAFARCEECNKDVPVVLISMHNCSLDAKIKMNLEAQVVEKPAEPKRKSADRKKTSSTEPKAKRTKSGKKGKDPNMPKRPATAFFVFMDDFRKTYKEENPDSKGVTMVTKDGGAKWKSMSDEEKKPYIDKAAELKAEYEKAMEKYNAEDEDGGCSEKEGSEKEGSDKEVTEKEVEEISDEE